MEEVLLCTKCKESKPLNDFPNRKNGRSGKSWNCKKCTNEYYRDYKKGKNDCAKLEKYLYYKLQMIKMQDNNKFPGYENDLSVADLLEVYNKYGGVCVYSGKRLKYGSKTSIYAKISFDRIDNSQPHKKDNIQLTSQFMNIFRGNRSHEEFMNMIKES